MRHRRGLIPAGLVTVVVLATAVAVGANLGLLTTAGSDSVGRLSASTSGASAAEPAPSDAQGNSEPSPPQRFIVEEAGHVDLVTRNEEILVDDVHAKTDWTWNLVQSSGRTLTVTFTLGSTTVRFIANLQPDGSLVTHVEEPVTKAIGGATSPASSGQPSNSSDDDHHESDEHEGSEDDD